MFNPKTNYALNKRDKDAIVYPCDGEAPIRLTREDFDTEADFLKWKAWSDEDYHDEEKREHIQANHSLYLSELADEVVATDGPEAIAVQQLEKLEHEQYTAEAIARLKEQLTDKQYNRLWMYRVDGMTQQEIADVESVGQRRISSSISTALERAKNIFSEGGKK